MPEQNNLNIKYTAEDIDRIFFERVTARPRAAALKPGIICEWGFEYPNGQRAVQVEYAFCVDPKNNNYATGCEVCNEKIKNKLWEICGQYSLITGEKL